MQFATLQAPCLWVRKGREGTYLFAIHWGFLWFSCPCLNASLRFVSVESLTRRYLLLVYFSIFMQFNIAQASQFVVTMHCISYASNNVFVTSEHVGSMSITISTRCADDHRRHISAAPTPSGEAACFMKGFSNLAAKTLASWCPRGRRAFLYQRLLTIHFLENTF